MREIYEKPSFTKDVLTSIQKSWNYSDKEYFFEFKVLVKIKAVIKFRIEAN